MRRWIWLACAGYFVFLSALLLVPEPAWLLGLRKRPEFPWGSFGVHWIAFAVLAILLLGARWPKPIGWAILAELAFYGTVTELVQYFVPLRHVRWIDWSQNMAGIATGAVAYWVALRWFIARRSLQQEAVAAVSPVPVEALAE